MSVTTSINIRLAALRTIALDGGGSQAARHVAELLLSWPDGTDDSEANEVWSERRTVNAGANDDLQLDNLTQLDADGNTVRNVSLANAKLIWVRNRSTTGSLRVGGAGGASFAGSGYPLQDDSDTANVRPGGAWFWLDPVGVAVTNGATDILRLTGIVANQDYEILVIGEKT